MNLNYTIQLHDTGRPCHVYGRLCKRKEILHELLVFELELITGWRIERDVVVGGAVPDGTAIIDGQTCHIEVDCSRKMTVKQQMKSKWKLYRESRTDADILVVTTSESRMKKLIEHAELVQDMAIFTTFTRLKKGMPWMDWYGNSVTL